jgi:hypothetical protein
VLNSINPVLKSINPGIDLLGELLDLLGELLDLLGELLDLLGDLLDGGQNLVALADGRNVGDFRQLSSNGRECMANCAEIRLGW